MSDPQSLSDVEPCLCGDPGCAHCGGYLSADIRVIMDGDIDEAIEHALRAETRDERNIRRAESVSFWCFAVGVLLVTFALGIMAFDGEA